MNDIDGAIKTIVDGIPKGAVFDSHFVIERLFLDYPNLYVGHASSTMENWHSQISGRMDDLRLSLSVERLDGVSFSFNLLHRPSPNAVWKKR